MDLNQTIAESLFENVQYVWEVLPKIKEFIWELAFNLSTDFERVGEDILSEMKSPKSDYK